MLNPFVFVPRSAAVAVAAVIAVVAAFVVFGLKADP